MGGGRRGWGRRVSKVHTYNEVRKVHCIPTQLCVVCLMCKRDRTRATVPTVYDYNLGPVVTSRRLEASLSYSTPMS